MLTSTTADRHVVRYPGLFVDDRRQPMTVFVIRLYSTHEAHAAMNVVCINSSSKRNNQLPLMTSRLASRPKDRKMKGQTSKRPTQLNLIITI